MVGEGKEEEKEEEKEVEGMVVAQSWK